MNIWPTDSELDVIFSKYAERIKKRELHLPFEEEMRALIQIYTSLPLDERLLITEYMKNEHRPKFSVFASDMAIHALNEQSIERVIEGLIALAAEGFIEDYRISRIVLSKLYHSTVLLGAEPVATFAHAIPYAYPGSPLRSQEQLLNFTENPTPNEKMELTLIQDAKGYHYVRKPLR